MPPITQIYTLSQSKLFPDRISFAPQHVFDVKIQGFRNPIFTFQTQTLFFRKYLLIF
jgi:hypothetical protein